ncbi:GDSL-type esterase/lipase family protein [Actinoplanes xinjiangensis]|uniref:GDSL-type esterase/lipase family protein n=1 Tax=Actinoplanes xinjiangensis TaxID=512350 RepID=UPI0023B30C76|nr:GDSL-type esterase/lipase family protein [Actinoplanes xinjiangensis]
MLGDSFAAGYGAARPHETAGNLVAGSLSRQAGRRVLLHRPAFASAMSSDLVHQVDAALRHAPDVAVIYIGYNDVTHFAPLKQAAREVGGGGTVAGRRVPAPSRGPVPT